MFVISSGKAFEVLIRFFEMSSISLFGLIDISLRNIFIVVVLLATIIFYNYKRWKLYVLASKLEGPVNYPIIGGAHHFLGLDTTGKKIVGKIFKIFSLNNFFFSQL